MKNTITITLTQEEFGAMAYAVNNEYYRLLKRRVLTENTGGRGWKGREEFDEPQ